MIIRKYHMLTQLSNMGVSRINIWISDVADPCGTWKGDATVSVLDCKGILTWPCGRYLSGNNWVAVPNGVYRNLPSTCGHLEVEVPPGCYWVTAGYVTPGSGYIHLNYTTHVGIVEACCDETACVKLFNPTVRLCWNWFLVGLRTLAANKAIEGGKAAELEKMGEALMKTVPAHHEEEIVLRELMQQSKR